MSQLTLADIPYFEARGNVPMVQMIRQKEAEVEAAFPPLTEEIRVETGKIIVKAKKNLTKRAKC